MLVTLKWLLGVVGKIILFPTVLLVVPIISLFTRADKDTEKDTYKRNFLYNIYIPYDNPIQGDRRWVAHASPFPHVVTGWKGYVNRVMWNIRNPLYGYNKAVAVTVKPNYVITIKGNPNTSDKYKISGWMFATLKDSEGNMVAWEWYSNYNYTSTRNIRIRLGWKIKTQKIWERGFARHVVTVNIFDSWG